MKAAIIAAFAASVFVAGCSCDCEKQQGAAVPADDSTTVAGQGDADTGSQREAAATGNDTHATRSSGLNSDQQRVGSGQKGVGNADTETGTNPYEQSSSSTAAPATQKPKKPGITGTYRTRASGTGTSSGRQVN